MDISNVINQFVDFINNSYDGIVKLFDHIEYDKKNVILADKVENGFYQFMWEIIVEAQLCEGEFLEPYGDGADFYGKSSRVVFPEKMASNKININVKNKRDYFLQKNITVENLDLIKFVHYSGGKYYVKSPFNFVLCEDYSGNQFLFRLNEVEFSLVKIEEND